MHRDEVTTTLSRTSPGLEAPRHPAGWSVPLIAAVAVAARVPGLGRAPRPDEAGFLAVGRQWHSGGTSLYGNYWVDRPPLLISIFRVAAQLGGVVPLRVIGCLATALVVVGVAHVARRVAGDGAVVWAALTAGALCVSPLLGGAEVNGELLSAPFVVGGIIAVVHALDSRSARRAWWAAVLAGAATVGALLVKQNIADVAIFAVTAGLVAVRRGEMTLRRLASVAVGFVLGAGTTATALAVWTVWHGTSLGGVFYAMYPFRVAAGHVLAGSTGSHAAVRLRAIVLDWVVSGAAGITVIGCVAIARRRVSGAVAWALVATVAFDSVSISLGGNYWRHYLTELIVPVSLLAGLLVVWRQPGMRLILVALALVAAVGSAAVLPHAGRTTDGAMVGTAIRDVATPTDTIVTAYGHADVTQVSGLSSPYAYLWSLPAKTLDPSQQELDAVLAGQSAPTWFVVWNRVRSWGLQTTRTSRLLSERYHPVAHLLGRTVYLRDGVSRNTPRLDPDALTRPTVSRTIRFYPAEGLLP